jgi:PAS domain S-box-containing protein
MRLRTPLLLGYAAVFAILFGSGAAVAVHARDDLRQTISRDAEARAVALMDEIELAMRERVHSLRTSITAHPVLHREIGASNEEFAALGSQDAIDALINERDAAWGAVATGEMNDLMRTIVDGEASRILRHTMEIHRRARGVDVFAEIFVTNRYGANVGQSGRTSDYRQNDEEWWESAWANGTWVSDEVSFDESAQVHSVDIGVLIEDAAAQPIGVLKAVMTVGVVRDIIDAFGTRSRLVGASVELIDARGSLVHRLGDEHAFGEDLSGRATVKALLDETSGARVETVDGEDLLCGFVGSHTAQRHDSPGWSLIVSQPTAKAFEPLNDMTRRMVIIGIVGASLAILVGWLIAAVFGRQAQTLENTTEALRGSEAHTRSIVNSAVDGIVVADTAGRIESFNPAAEKIFGRSAKDVIGQNVRILMPDAVAAEHDAYMARYLRTGEARVIGSQLEVHGVRADGTGFPMDLALSETKAAGKHCFVAVLRDATERKQSRRALRDAKDSAESASRSKSQFLANMSHELRTPLNAIIGYSEMITEELGESSPDDIAADLGKIRTAGLTLLGLIDQILDLSKVEAGRLETAAETFDLNQALTSIEATVLPLMRKRQNELVLDAPPNLGLVHSDVTKLRQILLNLLSNAAKFTEYGRVELHARREQEDHHDWMVFRVSDDGIGMSPEQLERVWDAFAQADLSTTRRYGGTGLGLTITRKFTELLGGSVDAASTLGHGTTFTVRIPAPPPPETPPDDGISPYAETVADGKTPFGAVLIIDDDEATRDLVRRYLEAEDFRVIEAASGDEGLRLARDRLPSAVVLDVLMPGMDGWSVLSAMREDPDLADVPVIMLTVSEERDLGFALGVDAYLSKPVRREALALALAPYHATRGPYRVLVVEDDAATRQLIARFVRRRGFEISEAANGADALDRLRDEGADLVIVDLMMPVMDGFELVREMRAERRWKDIPIVVVTAKDMTSDDARRLEGAVQEIVRKGRYSMDDLLDEVGRLVRRAVHQEDPPQS